jgi:hypothetical protein
MTSKVLVDYHHPDLYWSFVLLGRRLGWTIYRPIGMEFFNEGYWQFEADWAGDKFARMFLSYSADDINEGVAGYRPDLRHESFFNLVNLNQAREFGFDIVISTVPGNLHGFNRFAREVGARHVHQLGNQEHLAQMGSPIEGVDLLVSTNVDAKEWRRSLRYDQEMDPLLIQYSEPPISGPVSFFVADWHNREETAKYVEVAGHCPDIGFNLYGPDAIHLRTVREVADAIHESSIVYHSKRVGDGWGHHIHSVAGIGRPLVGNASYYAGRLAERLWTPDNSVDTSQLPPSDIGRVVSELWSDHGRIRRMGQASRNLFDTYIDYQRDADRIREFLNE